MGSAKLYGQQRAKRKAEKRVQAWRLETESPGEQEG